jgi:hypothetical protein
MSQSPTPPPSRPPARRSDGTSPNSGYKTTVTILFVLIGLPPGLCSLFFAPSTIGLLHGGSAESRFYAMLFGVPCLIGFVIFAVMLWWLTSTWRRAAP